MKKIFFKITVIVFYLTLLIACDDEEKTVQLNNYTIQLIPVLADNDEITGDLSGVKVTVRDVNTNWEKALVSDKEGKVYFTNLTGIYNIEASGHLKYSSSTNNGSIENITYFGGAGENLLLSEDSFSGSVEIYPISSDNGWVIKEMYTASTRTSNGSTLRFDQFIEIYNNTDTVMYADGLAIGETRHETTSGENIYADNMAEKTFLWTVYAIPGKDGDKNVPVEPGRSIVIAPQPIDHRHDNSIDLRPPVSDYQWFDAYGSGQYSIDVPEVPNLERYYSYSLSVWIVTVQMNRGFVIFKIPQSRDGGNIAKYVEDNTDMRFNNAGNMVTAIGVENQYVIDAVELGYKHDFYRKSLHSSLDKGRSYTLQPYNGKSIRRKILTVKPDGRVVYQDTNDSSVDFWTNRTPAPKQYPVDDEMSHE